MNALLQIPLEARLAVLALLGTCVAGQINRGVYRLSWNQRPIGPWSLPHEDAPPRHWTDRIPVYGWWRLRRESPLHGRGYWIRPLLLEIFTGLGFAALYWWEVSTTRQPLFPGAVLVYATEVHLRFLAHAILISLMLVVSFIDIDEKTIPDEITLPGTLLGLLFAAIFPVSLLPVREGFLQLTSPLDWGPSLNGTGGLVMAIACLAGWGYGILPKTWWTRSGIVKAFQYLAASIIRHDSWRLVLWIMFAGWNVIAVAWTIGGPHWQGLLSALIGMAFGGGLIWSVRAIGGAVLGREAMGFGDVTLMAMIGAFVGWQSSLVIFFLAPFAGLAIAVIQWVLTGRKDIAYGPFLCVGTLFLLVCWPAIWLNWGEQIFELGWWIPLLAGVCLLLMGIMLAVWRMVSERIFGR